MKSSCKITFLIVSMLLAFPVHAGSDRENTIVLDEISATQGDDTSHVEEQSKKKEKKCWSFKKVVAGSIATLLIASTAGTIPYDVEKLNEGRAEVEETTPVTVFGKNGTIYHKSGCSYKLYNGDDYRKTPSDMRDVPDHCLIGDCPEYYEQCVLEECGEPFDINKYVEECKDRRALLVTSIVLKSVVSFSLLTFSGIWLSANAIAGC